MTSALALAAVIGDPISHSRSPVLHGHWLRHHQINGHYVPLHVRPGDLRESLRLLPRLGFRGINVTIPHKEAVLALMDEVSPAARAIGAVNTVTFQDDGTVHGDNTDAYGFLRNLRQARPDWTPAAGPAALIGAGGAARAVVHALLDAGCPQIRVINRTAARAHALVDAFGDSVVVVPWDRPADALAGVATVVNGTSLGMTGQPPFTMDLSALPQTALATDLIYAPLQTAFLTAAAAQGCDTVDGLGMLLHQAVPGFARWFGPTPEVTEALRAAVLAA